MSIVFVDQQHVMSCAVLSQLFNESMTIRQKSKKMFVFSEIVWQTFYSSDHVASSCVALPT